ncbi:MAG: hypothetical protein ACOC9P_01345 [bacterium]
MNRHPRTRLLRRLLPLLLVAAACCASAHADERAERETLWASGFSLMPAIGFYPHGGSHGDTEPLNGTAAHGDGTLTWVADFPAKGTYQVWTRRYVGRGGARVLVNEAPVEGGDGRAQSGGGRQYAWYHHGAIEVDAGPSHVDVEVDSTFFDAVLFTRDAEFDPSQDALPEQTADPVFTAPRLYRDDAHLADFAGDAGVVIGALDDPYKEHHNDLVPTTDETLQTLSMWGSANQYVTATFAMRALEPTDKLTLRLDQLTGPDGTTLDREAIDLRIVQLRERERRLHASGHRDKKDLHDHTRGVVPDFLLRDDRTGYPPEGEQGGYGGGLCITDISAHRSRQVWVTVHVPEDAPAGRYRGEIILEAENTRTQALPVRLEVLPVDLQDVEGYYGSYHRARLDPDRPGAISKAQYLEDLKTQVRYGFNATTLYAGFDAIDLVREAGMAEAPVLMHNPGSQRHLDRVRRAKEMGFADLYFYGVDEPDSDDVDRVVEVAERANHLGVHLFMAINNPGVYNQIRAHVSRPVLVIYRFDARRAQSHVAYANEQDFRPVSYWTTADSFPLLYRALSGLYNTASGYHGISPWSSMDYATDAAPHEGRYVLHVPDESGKVIPSLRLEACRDGIDDVRYLQALDRAIAAAEQRLRELSDRDEEPRPALEAALEEARAVREARFESIDGWYFTYVNSLGDNPARLNATRRAFAEAHITLMEQLER